jgi:ABC-type amino acid transport substrate-binding protein
VRYHGTKTESGICQAFYHVICPGNQRQVLFRSDADRQYYLERLEQYHERYSFKVYAIRPYGLTGLVRQDINDHRAIGYWHIGEPSEVMHRKDIDSLAALRGKTIGVQSIGGGFWLQTMMLLDAVGVDPDKIGMKMRVIGEEATIVQALVSGNVDAAVVTLPSAPMASGEIQTP